MDLIACIGLLTAGASVCLVAVLETLIRRVAVNVLQCVVVCCCVLQCVAMCCSMLWSVCCIALLIAGASVCLVAVLETLTRHDTHVKRDVQKRPVRVKRNINKTYENRPTDFLAHQA